MTLNSERLVKCSQSSLWVPTRFVKKVGLTKLEVKLMAILFIDAILQIYDDNVPTRATTKMKMNLKCFQTIVEAISFKMVYNRTDPTRQCQRQVYQEDSGDEEDRSRVYHARRIDLREDHRKNETVLGVDKTDRLN